jgi:hypothetical protein
MFDEDDEGRKARCSWEGCWRTSTQPYTDGWAILMSWGPHVKDGLYCKAHADALEALEMEGALEMESSE